MSRTSKESGTMRKAAQCLDGRSAKKRIRNQEQQKPMVCSAVDVEIRLCAFSNEHV